MALLAAGFPTAIAALGWIVEVAVGSTDTLTATLAADAEFDQFTCLIRGHYEAGMFGTLTITGRCGCRAGRRPRAS